MNECTVFPNAPITEALLDIQVKLPKDVNLELLETFHDQGDVKEIYPEKSPRELYKASVKLSAKGSASLLPTTGGPDGYFFQTSNKEKVVQARLDGYTFNKLKPYESWKAFRSEARYLWDIYSQITNPVKITRIALRYINRIEIPLPMKDFKEYILTAPEIAPKLPQALANFFMRLDIPNPDIQANALITLTMNSSTIKDQKLPLIFDIDVSRSGLSFEDNKEDMWNEFEKLRTFKNEIFFNTITEKTKELFK